ncbi:MAG TPA: RNA polymerase sigma-70 factor [Prolixibacteraceae bacterium]|nr:RNA polymerase sigma-70 factor [Prolixibacteraceae bacterium]
MAFPPEKHSVLSDPFDDKGYERIFHEWYSSLCNYCFFLINDYDTAEDIVQELFVHLWENWERLKTLESVNGYLIKSVKNRSINYIKKHSKFYVVQLEENSTDLTYNLVPPAGEMVEKKELEAIIDNAIKNLPPRCRTIFILKRMNEMSNTEIAKELNISVKTVEAQMTIALKRLHQFVCEHWEFLIITGLLCFC